MTERFRSGDALFACAADMTIVLWNAEAERLTRIPATDALGRPCWHVLRGIDGRGGVVCHQGCPAARLVHDRWPAPSRRFFVGRPNGRLPVVERSVAVEREGEDPVVLHVLATGDGESEEAPAGERVLTPRQRQVLELLAEGVPAKLLARRLGITEVTARNHIHAILHELRCHSQLEAVAAARRRGLL